MSNGGVGGPSRRLMIGGSAAALAGCAKPWPKLPPPPGAGRIGVIDTHVHLFNASDLPVRGFLEYTIIRGLGDLGPFQSLIDLFVNVVKPFALTVVEERAALERGRAPAEVSPETFARAATDRTLGASPSVGRVARKAAGGRPDGQTRDEHVELVALLAAAFGEPGDAEQVRQAGTTAPTGRMASVRAIHYRAFLRAARSAEDPPEIVEAAVSRAARLLPGSGARTTARAGARLADVADAIVHSVRWAFIMLQPRTSHLARYLRSYHGPVAQPKALVNLLVDYSRWLDDAPDRDSGVAAQIDFWALAAAYYKDDIDLRTFAPYCPLQHAWATREGRPYLEEFDAAFAAGKIAGLKLYPPMGFYASGNDTQPDSAYVGVDGIKAMVVDDWNDGGAPMRLGLALQAGLDAAYDLCHRRGIPLLAHSGASQTPAANFADRPDPARWDPIAARHPNLHIMLGHFALDGRAFVDAMTGQLNGRSPPWAVTSTRDIVRRRRNVFVDLAYIGEILGQDPASTDFADAFFEQLRRWCVDTTSPFGGNDPTFDHIAYGSDWIMLQREADSRRYLEIIRAHLQPWGNDAFKKIFMRNGERFLKPTPAP